MEVHYHFDRNGVKHISVEGELENREDVAYVEALLSKTKDSPKSVGITFLDANILPSSLIESLYISHKMHGIEIQVVKSFLYSYLFKLGVPCKLITMRHSNRDNQGTLTIVDELDKESVGAFLKDINISYGYDYTGYQLESIIRRIKICMLRSNIHSFCDFRTEVLKDSRLFESLFLYFSISTTEFFRDPEVFEELRLKILPLLDSLPHIKIWSAGCSTGQEPYSLAILLKELGMLHKVQIYATDFNPYIIQEAKNGLFSISDIDKHIDNYRIAVGNDNLLNYFKLRNQYMEISPEIKNNILFFQHSLVGSGILNEFQLILCRNVLIYFNSSLQRSIMSNFHNSLDVNGYLVLGKSEGILHNEGSKYFKGFNPHKKIFKII